MGKVSIDPRCAILQLAGEFAEGKGCADRAGYAEEARGAE